MNHAQLTPEATGARLVELADTIRNNVNAREAIAEGFELVAGLMLPPCEDCGQPAGADQPSNVVQIGGIDPHADTTGQA